MKICMYFCRHLDLCSQSICRFRKVILNTTEEKEGHNLFECTFSVSFTDIEAFKPKRVEQLFACA